MDDPKKLGKYHIQSTLGQGAMGIVFKGFDPHIERTVAIKTIRKDAFDPKELEPLLARFKREAQAAGRLTHPSIVTVYEYGDEGNSAFIAMEFVHGKELKEFLDNNERFPFETTIDITNQLLSALAYSHKQGVVHRDIKPGNILVLEDGHIKITDFGIARIESSNLTQFGDVMGTPSYMSPEQFMGQQVDNRSDIFSAGVILYHLLTGEKPFPGNSMATIMHRALNTHPPRVSELNFQIPNNIDSIVEKALAKSPSERFQSADEFSAALNNAGHVGGGPAPSISKLSIPITREEETVKLPGDDQPVASKNTVGTHTKIYRQGRNWTLTALVMLILTAGSFMVWRIYSEQLSADDLKLLVREKIIAFTSLLDGDNNNDQVQEIFQSSKKKPSVSTKTPATVKVKESAVTASPPSRKVSQPLREQIDTSPAQTQAVQNQPAQLPVAVQPVLETAPQPQVQPATQTISKPASVPTAQTKPVVEKEYAPIVRKAAPGRMLKDSEW